MMIDYIKFVKVLDSIRTEEELDFLSTHPDFLKVENMNLIKENLLKYLKDNGIQASQLLRKIYDKKTPSEGTALKKISVDDLSHFLFNLCKNSPIRKKDCTEFAGKIDIDHDGQIDDNDIQTFLNRCGYIDQADRDTIKYNTMRTIPTNTELFPRVPLSEERIESVLRELRQALDAKKYLSMTSLR